VADPDHGHNFSVALTGGAAAANSSVQPTIILNQMIAI
jgi:hypothetical protein